MQILLRETDEGTIVALHPETGEPLTKIGPGVWCDSCEDVSTAYEHAGGIYWSSWDRAREQLAGKHEIVTD